MRVYKRFLTLYMLLFSRDGSFKPASLKPGHYSSPLSKGLSTLKGTDSFKPWDSRLDGQKAEMSYGNDMNCSVRLDSVRCDSFSGAGNSVRFDSVRSSYQTGAGHSVRLDSVRSEFLTEVGSFRTCLVGTDVVYIHYRVSSWIWIR